MIIVYIILFLLLIILAIILLAFAFDSIKIGHDLNTSRRAIRALVKAMKQYKPDAKNFYDLGCSRGTLSLFVNKIMPGLEIYGVDNSAVRIFFARLKTKILRRKISFMCQDILKLDLSQADVVYTYLWYDLMPVLEKKLQNELKPGAIVITNTSNFPTWKPIQEIITYPKTPKTPDFETLFVYMKE